VSRDLIQPWNKAEDIQYTPNLVQLVTPSKVVVQLILAIKHLTTVGTGVEWSIVLLHMTAVFFAATESIDATIGTLNMAISKSLKAMVAGGLDDECGAVLRLVLRPVWN
jgi:hypothetical protein